MPTTPPLCIQKRNRDWELLPDGLAYKSKLQVRWYGPNVQSTDLPKWFSELID